MNINLIFPFQNKKNNFFGGKEDKPFLILQSITDN
jgi:hypothetical protein